MQEVLRAAAEAQDDRQGANQENVKPAFNMDETIEFVQRNEQALRKAAQKAAGEGQMFLAEDLSGATSTLAEVAARDLAKGTADLEELERRFSVLEDKITASLTRACSVDLLSEFRAQAEKQMSRYRRKMTAPQIESLERQFLKRQLFEHYQIPRLSLFYL